MNAGSHICLRCGSALEQEDLRCPVCYRASPVQPSDRAACARRDLLRCESCGAGMEYRAEVEALQCAFCGGAVRRTEELDPLEQAQEYLLFTVDREEAEEAYRSWLHGLGFFRPSDLRSRSTLQSLRALWWVGWVFDADAEVSWTADSDAGARRAPWAPHSGEFRMVFKDVVVPGTRGLTVGECERLIPTYALGSGVDHPKSGREEAVLERFEVLRSSARGRVVEAIQRLAHNEIRDRRVPGSRSRNIRSSIHLRGLSTRRVAFPAYVLAYRYGDRLYRAVISGQEAGCVVGEAPRSVLKLVLVVAAGLAAIGVGLAALVLR